MLVFIASLVPAVFLIGASWYLQQQASEQLDRQSEEMLHLAINLQQSLLDARTARMKERAISLAGRVQLVAAVQSGSDLAPVLDSFYDDLPGADLITVVNVDGVVQGRAGSYTSGDRLSYGGLIAQVLESRVASGTVEWIASAELANEPARVLTNVRMPIVETEGSEDPRAGQVLEDALAMVGAAPILDAGGEILGLVLVSDILNNDHQIVDEVTHRAPQGLPLHATIALDGIRVTTTVPAVGGGRRAVGTLYSDVVMERLRKGQEYRGSALVGGYVMERTIYLPVTDHAGRVVAGSFVGVPETRFAALAERTDWSTRFAGAGALVSILIAVTLAYHLARTQIARPLAQFIQVLTEGDLQTRVEAGEGMEMHRLAAALNSMTDRVRQTVGEIARVSHGVREVSDNLADGAGETAENAEAALQIAESALRAAEAVSASAQRTMGRMRELELALARIDMGTDEQARALRYASEIVTLVTGAVQDSRRELAAVQEATRQAVAAAQRGRHSALRTVSVVDLVRVGAQTMLDAGGPTPQEWTSRVERLATDLEEGQAAANACDDALREIARSADEANGRIWEMAAVLNENGARAGAVSQQMADLSDLADGTATHIRSMSGASRQVIGEVEAIADGIEAAVGLVRRAEDHVTSIAEANRRLRSLSERIRTLAHELDRATQRFPLQ